MRQIFLDTETTGLVCDAGDRIVEIGCVEMLNRRLSGNRLHVYLNPGRPSHPDALRVHGLTDEFLSDKPAFEHVVEELLSFVGDAEIIIHNAAFDIAFLNAELARVGREPLHTRVSEITCSLTLAREIFPGKANSLDALCKRLEVDNSNRALHGALLDAGLLAEVYLRMTRGQGSLVIDAGDDDGSDGARALAAIDLSAFALPVLRADAAEAAAHDALIAALDRDCGGRAVWRAAPEREPAMA